MPGLRKVRMEGDMNGNVLAECFICQRVRFVQSTSSA
jgi:hypothetical protein